MLTPAQSRAGRALVEMSQEQLAAASHLGLSTIRDLEKGRRVPTHNNLAAIHRALEVAGVIFVPENGEGPGVRLKKIETVEAIAYRIEVLEATAASIPEPSEPSPETGMNIMRKAAAENEVVELRHKRKRLRKAKHKGQAEDAS